jgi:hypothetical protein
VHHPALVRCPANDDRFVAQRRRKPLFHRCEEGVGIDVENVSSFGFRVVGDSFKFLSFHISLAEIVHEPTKQTTNLN